jgi:hypothetical protein
MPHIPQIYHLTTFFYSHNLKRAMKGHFYADIQTIKTAVTEQLRSIPESAFRSFRNAGNGVSLHWDYFEGDKQQ